MAMFVRGLALSLTLALALGTVAARAADDDDKKEKEEAQKAVLDLTKLVEDGKGEKAAVEKAAAIRKKFDDLNTVMHVYKPKSKGGIGYGAKATDGIESRIQALDRAKNPPSPMVVEKEKGELTRLAYINIAMAELAKQYFTKPQGGKGKKDWEKHCEDQKKAAEDLAKAVKAGDNKAVKAAIKGLNDACNACHGDFRSSN